MICKVQIRHKEEQFSLNTEHVIILYGYCLKPDQLFASKLACYFAFLLIFVKYLTEFHAVSKKTMTGYMYQWKPIFFEEYVHFVSA